MKAIRIPCLFCKGKGYKEIEERQGILPWNVYYYPKPFPRVHCPACYGLKWCWEIKQ